MAFSLFQNILKNIRQESEDTKKAALNVIRKTDDVIDRGVANIQTGARNVPSILRRGTQNIFEAEKTIGKQLLDNTVFGKTQKLIENYKAPRRIFDFQKDLINRGLEAKPFDELLQGQSKIFGAAAKLPTPVSPILKGMSNISQKAVPIAKDVTVADVLSPVQLLPRLGVGAAMELKRGGDTTQKMEYRPQGILQKAVLGTTPLRPLGDVVKETVDTQAALQDVGAQKLGLEQAPMVSKLGGAAFAPALIGLGAGIEAVPGGKLATKAAREGAETLVERAAIESGQLGAQAVKTAETAVQEPIIKATQQFSKLPEKEIRKITSKFNFEKGGNDVLQEQIARTGYKKEPITWEETIQEAEKLGVDPGAILKKNAQKLTRAELLALRDVVSNNTDFIIKAQKFIDDPARSDKASLKLKQELDGQIELVAQQNDQLLSKYLVGRSEAGRTLNSLRIVANKDLDPVTWQALAKRAMGQDRLTDEVTYTIQQYIDSSDRAGLANYISTLSKTGLAEKGVTLWKAGLLTSGTTHTANMLGNLITGVGEKVKDVPGTIIDWGITGGRNLKRAATGEEKVGRTTFMTVGGNAQGLKEGAKKGYRLLKTGVDVDRMLAKYDIPKKVNYNNPIVQKYVDTVFNLLGAEDAVFRQRAIRDSLYNQAYAIAKNEKLKGDMFKQRLRSLIESPTDEMTANAINVAEYQTFQNENILASGFAAAKRGAAQIERKLGAAPVVSKGADVIVPFVKTPTNVASMMIDYSPAGFLKTVVRQMRKEPMDRSQKALVDGLARATTGTSVIALGAYLASKGLITGNSAQKEGERETLRAAGVQPQSAKIGDTYYRISRLGPIGMLLTLGAEMNNIINKNKSLPTGEKIATTAAESGTALAKGITEQNFLLGASKGLQALTQPDRSLPAFSESLAGGIVPNLISRVAQKADPYQKQVDNPVDAILADIPFVSKKVENRTDILGRKLKTTPKFISPFTTLKETKNPLAKELVATETFISPIKAEKNTISYSGQKFKLNDKKSKEYEVYSNQLFQQAGLQLIQSPGWNELSKEDKKKLFQQVQEKAREAGKIYILTQQ